MQWRRACDVRVVTELKYLKSQARLGVPATQNLESCVAQTHMFAASALLRTLAERRQECRRSTQSACATTSLKCFVSSTFMSRTQWRRLQSRWAGVERSLKGFRDLSRRFTSSSDPKNPANEATRCFGRRSLWRKSRCRNWSVEAIAAAPIGRYS